MKKLFKYLCSLLAAVVILPLFLLHKLEWSISKSENFFNGITQFLSLFPGLSGRFLRREFYKRSLRKCGANCCIGFGTIIVHPTAEIGNNVYIGGNCTIGTVTIGDNALIGSNVDIPSGKHQHNFDETGHLTSAEHGSFKRIFIGSDSWIENSCVVLANIGKGCVIGAGSVVVKEVSDFSIAAGNPARTMRKSRGKPSHN